MGGFPTFVWNIFNKLSSFFMLGKHLQNETWKEGGSECQVS